MSKLSKLFGSRRFWLVTTLGALVLVESLLNGSFDVPFLFNTLEMYVGVVLGIGVVDKAFEKLGSGKK